MNAPSPQFMRCGILEWLGGVGQDGRVHLRWASAHRHTSLMRCLHRFRIAGDSGDVFWTSSLAGAPHAQEAIEAAAARKGIQLSGRWRSGMAEFMASIKADVERHKERVAAALAEKDRREGKPQVQSLQKAKSKILTHETKAEKP